jgi:hypothetical protein
MTDYFKSCWLTRDQALYNPKGVHFDLDYKVTTEQDIHTVHAGGKSYTSPAPSPEQPTVLLPTTSPEFEAFKPADEMLPPPKIPITTKLQK